MKQGTSRLQKMKQTLLVGLALAFIPLGGTTAQVLTGKGIENIVTVSGVFGEKEPTTVSSKAYAQVLVVAAQREMTLVKRLSAKSPGGTGPNGNYVAGDSIIYEFEVKNSGNTYLYNVAISDPFSDATGKLSAINHVGGTFVSAAPNGTSSDALEKDETKLDYDRLAPGDSVLFQATYTVTSKDMTTQSVNGDGILANTATAVAEVIVDQKGTREGLKSKEASAKVTLDIVPSLSITKTSDVKEFASVGQVVTYTYVVTNDGTVAINQIALVDEHTNFKGTSKVTPDFASFNDAANGITGDSADTAGDNVMDTLAPKDTVTFTWKYTVTQEDIDQLQ